MLIRTDRTHTETRTHARTQTHTQYLILFVYRRAWIYERTQRFSSDFKVILQNSSFLSIDTLFYVSFTCRFVNSFHEEFGNLC